MARRGFFAELQHQAQIAARERERAQRAALHEHNARVRQAEQAQRVAKLAQKQRAAETEAERKRLEKEAREEHIADMEAEAEERNHTLAEIDAEIDSLLAAALRVSAYVDLKSLRAVAAHPPFDQPELEKSAPAPTPPADPAQPGLVEPTPPTGLSRLFGKTKYAEAVAEAQQAHAAAISNWRTTCEELHIQHQAALVAHAHAESARLAALEVARGRYAETCASRDVEVAEFNAHLDELITNLSYGAADAVQEYVSIVFSNSLYSRHFAVTHEFHFEQSSAELTLRALVSKPDSLPEVKAYKYSKSSDEIVATSLPPKACRDRYESAVHQVALRSLHGVFESDRRGIIKTIRLEVGTEAVHPATGRLTYVPLVVVGAERGAFLELNLSAVVPTLALGHLGASVSRNPYGLVAADVSGVRRS